MMWRLRADHEQKQEFGDVTITQGLDAKRPITEALLWQSDWNRVTRGRFLLRRDERERIPCPVMMDGRPIWSAGWRRS
jgi:hypothetical protein